MIFRHVHLFVIGRVQGVFFRANSVYMANKLNVVGWVRNVEDGSVEIVAEGEDKNIEQFIDWCRRGSPAANVIDIRIEEDKQIPMLSYNSFEVAY